jgi:alkylation response protein AidB-like acyl-CoA dehydrogenase
MDFELSEEERAIGDGVRALCAGRFPLDKVRAAEGADRTVDVEAWPELGAAGVFSVLVSEDEGGLGLGLAHAAVVFEELGRALIPGPLVASALAAGLVPGAMDGSVVVGSARLPAGEGPVIVEHLASLDALVVLPDGGPSDAGPSDAGSSDAGSSDAGPSEAEPLDTEDAAALAVVDPSALGADGVTEPLDPLTPEWVVRALPAGDALPGGAEGARRWERHEQVLTGALCVGIAAATLDLAVAYAKERMQFGSVIGTFQAVKHLCADMLVRTESARVAVQAAAVTADQPEVGDAVRAAAGAALVATEAAIANAKACIQVHGGMGFTWELPIHLYLKRARVLAASLAPPHRLAGVVAARY